MTDHIYYWQRIQRGAVRLTPKMWHSPDGDIIPLHCDIKGTRRTIGKKSPVRLVRFDKYYVVQFVVDRIIKALSINSREQLEELLMTTWNVYQSKEAEQEAFDEEE